MDETEVTPKSVKTRLLSATPQEFIRGPKKQSGSNSGALYQQKKNTPQEHLATAPA